MLSFAIDVPHKEHGEDGPPVLHVGDDGSQCAGVFDGLGGAGAKRYETVEGSQSGARIAAYECSKTYAEWLTSDGKNYDLADLMHAIRVGLDIVKQRFPSGNGPIKSKMIRDFPSTIAVTKVVPALDGCSATVACGWAGDSRVYVLSPAHGLSQITQDHTKESVDAQQNLALDSPLSNFAYADGEFFLEHCEFNQNLPLAVIAATDGCFGYVSSPIYFELMIVRSLVDAESPEACRELLANAIKATTSDDATLVAVLCGWRTWDDVRRSFETRLIDLQATVARFDDMSSQVSTLSDQLATANERKTNELAQLWAKYRRSYETRLTTSRSGRRT